MTNLTQGDDTYNGGSGDDIVNGLGGNDTINGNGGDDTINGGAGNDTIDGGSGDDQISGGSGNDRLTGGLGNDIMIGGSGIDTAVINADGANGIGSANGGVLTVLTADGQDQLSGIEFIQFNNGTVAVVNGNADAYLGADTNSIFQQGSATGNVSSNDFDIDNTMTITGFHNNANTTGTLGSSLHGDFGTLTLNADGTYSYSADANTNTLGVGESAVDVYTYTVHSNGQDYTQTLTITINGTNDAPDITSSASSTSYNDTAGDDNFPTFTGTLTASDVDTHDTLTYGIQGGAADNSQGGFDTALAGTYGTLYINSSTGAYEYVPDDAAIEALKSGASDNFTFTVSDGHGGTDSQAFTVTLNGVNDTPTLGGISGMTFTDTSADDTFPTQSGSLVASDRDNDTLSYHATGESADGSQSGFDMAVAGTYGTLYFSSSTGAYEYIPNDGAIEGLKTTASDTFAFHVNDGSIDSGTQTLTVTLNGVNDTPDIIVGSASNQLTEAGGVLNADSGTAFASASTTLSDRDTGDTPHFDTSALTTAGWTTSDGGLTYTKVGTYGSATITLATGVVTYALDNNDSDTQGLQTGQTAHDIFTLPITDGSATNSATVDFTINGDNDAAVISGSLSGSATEAGTGSGSAATGTATDSDVDNTANTFQVVSGSGATTNGYGTFAIDASGHWTFTVNDGNATVDAMNVGDSLTDSFTIHSADGTAQTVTVTIYGANDAAIVSGTTGGTVVESGGPLFSGTPTVSGHLSDTDVDNLDNLFQVASSTLSDQGHGSYTIDASGNWSFTLNNSLASVQALNDGDHITETFTVHTFDGTDQVISIVIDGHNEVFSGTANNDVMNGTVYGDTMSGGDGNDVYRVNNTADVVVENANQGEDTVQASVTYTLGANVEDLNQSGNGNIDATGNTLDNLIVGNNGSNVLSGLAGDDVLRGGAGSDTLLGGAGDDNMDGGIGIDTVSYANAAGSVTVSLALTGFQNTGSDGFDKIQNVENITGSAFDDTLSGNADRNVITGGGGADHLTGGTSIDTFVYTSIGDSSFGNADTITDLTNADKIDLTALGNDFTLVHALDGHAHEILVSYNAGTNTTTISIDMNGDGTIDGSDMQILATGDHHTFSNFLGLGS